MVVRGVATWLGMASFILVDEPMPNLHWGGESRQCMYIGESKFGRSELFDVSSSGDHNYIMDQYITDMRCHAATVLLYILHLGMCVRQIYS